MPVYRSPSNEYQSSRSVSKIEENSSQDHPSKQQSSSMDHNYAAMAKLPSLPTQAHKIEGIAKAKELVRNNFNKPIEPIRESHFSPLFNSKRSPRNRSKKH